MTGNGQDLADDDAWSNSEFQALVTAHASLIQDYKCVERRPQDPVAVIPAPVTPADFQAPQASTPLLTPPLDHLALLQAARAHGENAENAQDRDGHDLRMPDQRKITAAIMMMMMPFICSFRNKNDANGLLTEMRVHSAHRMTEAKPAPAPHHADNTMHKELDFAPSKRKTLNWTPFARLNSLGHRTGFSTSEDFNKKKVLQDWTSFHCQQLELPIPPWERSNITNARANASLSTYSATNSTAARNMRAPRWPDLTIPN